MPRHTAFFSLVLILYLSSCATLDLPREVRNINRDSWTPGFYVQIDSGYLKGKTDRENTLTWKGIPFAAPPVGGLRWKAPVAVTPWQGVRNADNFGSKAVQVQSIFTAFTVGSEDCLSLNVWRPDSEEENLPVYVWIHGGGNSIGSSDLSDYHGYAVAGRSNAVFVSVNYRLGPFGWFKHPVLESGDELDDSGNYGLLDILFALKWIQNNIRSFGGDSGNVTISGESAGGNNILTLMQSPLATGLFHKSVIQSGYKRSVSPSEAEEQADDLIDFLLSRKNLDRDQLTDREIKTILLESKAKDILRFYTSGNTGMINHLYHIEDGTVFPSQDIFANPVPTIIGSNKDETKLFMFFSNSVSWRSDLYEIVASMGSLDFKERGVDSIASQISGNQNHPPVYAYRFDWGTLDEEGSSPLPGNWGKRLGSFHTLEIPFFLGTESINGPLFTSLLFNRNNQKSRDLLTDEIMEYLRNFMYTGNPNGEKPMSLEWPQWDEKHQYIVFNGDENELDISLSDEISSREQLLDELRSSVPAEKYSEILEILRW